MSFQSKTLPDLSAARRAMRNTHYAPDPAIIDGLITAYAPSREQRVAIGTRAALLVDRVREDTTPGMTEAFLMEYGLSTDEGVAVMTLAEALLRVPDGATRDALIEDKTTGRDWHRHSGKSDSRIVNLSTLALSATGKVLSDARGDGPSAALRQATKRLGAPVIRAAVGHVMQQLGHQFVLGETIEAATERATKSERAGYTHSYDMLGEAAITAADAQRFHAAYEAAIHHIGGAATGDSITERAGISVKLSALFPRYEFLQRDAVMVTLVDRLRQLCLLAAQYDIGLNVDAEEADRLDLSLDVIEAVLQSPDLTGWDGFGVVVQAYGKRASCVIDWLHGLAIRHDRRIMVRLVKGAYWDTEIKAAQVQGLSGFPVFSTKAATDISYICCARKLMAMRDRIYPQFATHNAHSVAAIIEMAGDTQGYEFQRLHGMGEALHQVTMAMAGSRCRIYAPVGSHKELLAYLVRRLLENGANSSFVNQIVNEDIPTEAIVADPFDAFAARSDSDGGIAAPGDLYQPERVNSKGFNIQDIAHIEAQEKARAPFMEQRWEAYPLTAVSWDAVPPEQIINPANPDDIVGMVQVASPNTVAAAIAAATPWETTAGIGERAAILMRAADLYEQNIPAFTALLMREAGKTIMDGIAEIREAVDFLRYYAAQSKHHPGTVAKGRIAAISPWNFPLAIFTGQIAAALAAGNAVLAKPAEATPLIAHFAVRLLQQAGVPCNALQCLPGTGANVGHLLTADPRIDGVCFTGSTNTAQIINRNMAQHLAPAASLLAETGGLNAMIVDSTALPEQAVRDIVASAFQSAGQRCSALRVLYVQEDIADTLETMLAGAMDALCMGDPSLRATDVGPVIDGKAKAAIEAHIARHQDRVIKQLQPPASGHFVAPTLIALDGIEQLDAEIFGPVLHICRYRAGDLDRVIEAVNATGFGLTFGLHSRISARTDEIAEKIEAGNIYINRNQIGAVVGSQPFGGEGLSGTGPKAGGKRYLTQFLQHPGAVTPSSLSLPHTDQLPGPTGESNLLTVSGRGVILCLGPGKEAQARQKTIVEANGNTAILTEMPPEALIARRGMAGVAFCGKDEECRAYRRVLASRKGEIIPLLATDYALNNFVRERHVCIDTTAAGGNASLLAAAG